MQKYLKLFNLNPGFTEEELKVSYRSLCSKYHPDKTGGRTTALFQEVQLGKKELDDNLKSRNPSSYESTILILQGLVSNRDEYIIELRRSLKILTEENERLKKKKWWQIF